MSRKAEQPAVLLADADAIVSMDLGDALTAAGYRVLGPFATTAEALQAIERETPALAVVDASLRDGPGTALILGLRQRQISVVFYSALSRDEIRAMGFSGAPYLRKPVPSRDVITLLDELAFSHSAGGARAARPAEGAGNPFVRKLANLTVLSDADKARLAAISAQPRIVAPQVDIVREGDRPEGVFLVLEGFACRHKVRATGARQIAAYLVPGDLGDLDVALLGTMDHTITALSACKVVCIPPKIIAELVEHHPRIARVLRLTTLVDAATLREWLTNVGCRSALERIAHLFCELQVRLEAVGLADDDGYDLPITQADLADTTGLSSVHVNRMLQELRKRGLVELRGRRLRIVDLPQLKALAEFTGNYLGSGNRTGA